MSYASSSSSSLSSSPRGSRTTISVAAPRNHRNDLILFLSFLGFSFVVLFTLVQVETYLQRQFSPPALHHSSSSPSSGVSRPHFSPRATKSPASARHRPSLPHPPPPLSRSELKIADRHSNVVNNSSSRGNDVSTDEGPEIVHPTWAEFQTRFRSPDALGETGAKIAKWEREHPPPKPLSCPRKDIRHVEPVFFTPRPLIALISMHSIIKHTADEINATERRTRVSRASVYPLIYYCKKHRYDLIIEDHAIVDSSRPPAWSKLRALRKWLPFYEWVVWLDMDVIITNFTQSVENFIAHRESLISAGNRLARERYEANMKAFVAAINRSRGAPLPAFLKEPAMRPQPNVIIGNDWNGINSGITLYRNTTWTMHFLKRTWSVPAELARPYWDQGGLRYNFGMAGRGRDEQAAKDDVKYLDITSELNRYPMGLLFWAGTQAKTVAWKPGDWLIHMASCKHFPSCVDWMESLSSIVECGYHMPHLLLNFTMTRPFHRTDIHATAPPLNEPLEPIPTKMRPFKYHFPHRLLLVPGKSSTIERAQRRTPPAPIVHEPQQRHDGLYPLHSHTQQQQQQQQHHKLLEVPTIDPHKRQEILNALHHRKEEAGKERRW